MGGHRQVPTSENHLFLLYLAELCRWEGFSFSLHGSILATVTHAARNDAVEFGEASLAESRLCCAFQWSSHNHSLLSLQCDLSAVYQPETVTFVRLLPYILLLCPILTANVKSILYGSLQRGDRCSIVMGDARSCVRDRPSCQYCSNH